MTIRNAAGRDAGPARLVLVEQSGAKHDIPQPSALEAMIEAEHVMDQPGWLLRQVKVVTMHTAVARWKAGELGWRRVA
jgi:hypothetical protein